MASELGTESASIFKIIIGMVGGVAVGLLLNVTANSIDPAYGPLIVRWGWFALAIYFPAFLVYASARTRGWIIHSWGKSGLKWLWIAFEASVIFLYLWGANWAVARTLFYLSPHQSKRAASTESARPILTEKRQEQLQVNTSKTQSLKRLSKRSILQLPRSPITTEARHVDPITPASIPRDPKSLNQVPAEMTSAGANTNQPTSPASPASPIDPCPPTFMIEGDMTGGTIISNLAPPCATILRSTGRLQDVTIANNSIFNPRYPVTGPYALVYLQLSQNNKAIASEFVSVVTVSVITITPVHDTIGTMEAVISSEHLTGLEFGPTRKLTGKTFKDIGPSMRSDVYGIGPGNYYLTIHESAPSPFYMTIKCYGDVECQVVGNKGLSLARPAESGGVGPHP